MFKKLRFIVTLVCLIFSVSAFSEELTFIDDDLRTGMSRASTEGKLVFLEFWASYCSPCKMMEEYTFTNQDVISRMNNSYVPVKVNIQSFDGYDLKNQFKVSVLPTIIILDSKGRQVARYEETMAPSKLITVLDKYNLPQNRSRSANYAANNNTTSPYKSDNTTLPPAPLRNVLSTNSSTSIALATPMRSSPASIAERAISQRKSITSSSTPAINSVSEVGIRRALPTDGFTIQTGAYAQLSSAQEAAQEMKAKIGGQKQYILQSKVTGKITYRIFIGYFASRQQADMFRKKTAIEGYTRGFDEFSKKK